MNRATQTATNAAKAFRNLERRIAADEKGGILHRWHYGRDLLPKKVTQAGEPSERLEYGLIDLLIKDAGRHGLKVSRREIQYRMRCAEAYDTEEICARAVRIFGSWEALRDAGFPPGEGEEIDADDVTAAGLASASDEYSEQLEIDIPGLKPVIKVHGRQVAVVRGEDGATVADIAAYLEMNEKMHESFGRTVKAIRESLATMREGADGDEQANAVEAWEAATEDTDERRINDEPHPRPPGKPLPPPSEDDDDE
jgi:hypothetical protein